MCATPQLSAAKVKSDLRRISISKTSLEEIRKDVAATQCVELLAIIDAAIKQAAFDLISADEALMQFI